MKRSVVFDWLVYFLVRLFICFIQSLRSESHQFLARAMAWLLQDVLGVRQEVIDENIRHAYPQMSGQERSSLGRQMWRHLVLMLCEIALASRKIHETNWREHITIREKKRLVELFLDTRPTVVVAGHFGNFEMGGFLSGLLGFPTYTIARPLDNPFLHRFLSRYRGATGQFILPTRGSAEAAGRVLDAGETLALLGDQYAGAKGCWVDFFGRPASCHKALALFSLASGAPMAVVYAKRLNRPLQFELGLVEVADPVEHKHDLATVPELTQWYNRCLEKIINTAPDQYWWLHRRWKDPRRRKARTATIRADRLPAAQVAQPHASTTMLGAERNKA